MVAWIWYTASSVTISVKAVGSEKMSKLGLRVIPLNAVHFSSDKNYLRKYLSKNFFNKKTSERIASEVMEAVKLKVEKNIYDW